VIVSPSTTQFLLEVTFWFCAGATVYTYLLYPALIYAMSRLRGREPAPPADAPLPKVALVIAAHNEAQILEDRIRNALETDYPVDRFRVVIASDGSSDDTARVCESFGERIQALLFPTRRGKAATLDDAIRRTNADVIILSDANTFMEPDAVRLLVRWFQDPTVGAVCGRLVLTDPATGRNADGLYWRYETFLKTCEARLGALLGANGAIYAIRRELLAPIPANTIVDDFVIPLAAKLRTNCRLVYEPLAIAREESAPNLHAEFGRRVRIGIGGWQSLATLWPLLGPAHGWTALALWSHKVLRWACPFMLLGSFAAAAALAAQPLFAALALIQVVFHAICIFGGLGPTSRFRVLRLFGMFFAMNLALLVGFASWLRGGHTGTWRRTARSAGNLG
jgi:cellulose synthase/poly-beta-1,6-N-acetylglucosamine synthase-like glycosyltransferase